jgi:hypothetical protein
MDKKKKVTKNPTFVKFAGEMGGIFSRERNRARSTLEPTDVESGANYQCFRPKNGGICWRIPAASFTPSVQRA